MVCPVGYYCCCSLSPSPLVACHQLVSVVPHIPQNFDPLSQHLAIAWLCCIDASGRRRHRRHVAAYHHHSAEAPRHNAGRREVANDERRTTTTTTTTNDNNTSTNDERRTTNVERSCHTGSFSHFLCHGSPVLSTLYFMIKMCPIHNVSTRHCKIE